MLSKRLYKYCFYVVVVALFIGCQAQNSPSKSFTLSPTAPIFKTPTFTLTPNPTLEKPTSITTVASTDSNHLPKWCPVIAPSLNKSTIRLTYTNFGDKTDVWLWDDGTEPVQITELGDVANVSISDDGKIIVFTRQVSENQVELWSIRSDGTHLQRLISSGDSSPIFGTLWWIHNTHIVVFNSRDINHNDDRSSSKIWAINAETGVQKHIGTGNFSYSPDGKYIAIFGENGIDLYNADGSPHRLNVLPEYRIINEKNLDVFIEPSWSEDSLSLLVVQPETNDIYQPDATFSIRQIRVTAPENINLGTYMGFALGVDFSPDHQFMFYLRDASLRPSELHLVNLQTSENIIYIKEDAVEFGEWSPNSQDFIFYIIYDIRVGNICLGAKDAKQLPYHTGSTFIDWIDNTTYMVKERVDTSWEIFFEHLDDPTHQANSFSIYDYDVVTIPNP